MSWRPSASLASLQKRAQILKEIRNFFYARGVLEVETPLMCPTSVTDPYIQSIPALIEPTGKFYYLQTSPEYAMKRLLAADSGPIFQICKAFRQNEHGRFHHSEFTMLEWYQLDYDHRDLMNEVDEFLQAILELPSAEKISYAELFQSHFHLDPHTASVFELEACAKKNNIAVAQAVAKKDDWLNLLMSHIIEPNLGFERPCFVYDFPASQAALARINAGSPQTAARFEVYIKGIELANGFHELTDAEEQRQRFESNLAMRKSLGLPAIPIDEELLAALASGLPDCAGVALGIDRLIMLATQCRDIREVIFADSEDRG